MNVNPRPKHGLSSATGLVLRGFSITIGLLFVAWAFSSDVRITGGPGFGITQSVVLTIGLLNIFISALRIDWLFGVVICQASIIVTLILAEFLLRSVFYPRYYSPYQLESRYLYNLVPGAVREHRVLEINGGSTLYKVNSLGFRGEEFPLERTAKPRIAIYGDSFIHAEFTELENTLASQLQSLLSSRMHRGIEVVNAGVAGYGPDQALRRLENELGWLEPDLLVVALFSGNDFGDLVRNKLYRVGADGNAYENTYTLSDEIVLHAELDSSEFILKKMAKEVRDTFSWRLQGEKPFDSARMPEKALELHLAEYKEYVIDGDNVVRQLRVDPYSADVSLLPDSPSTSYKLKLMDGVIGRIVTTADAHNVPLLLLIIPHPMDVLGGSHISGVVDRQKYPEYQPDRLAGSIERIAERRGVDYINLYSFFRDVDDPAGLYLKAGDDHWNNAGQRYAAEIIAQWLSDNPELSKSFGLSR